MARLPRLNFPAFRFKVATFGETMRIWSQLRKVWIALTPEEWVRQHLLMHLIENCGAPDTLISEECPVCIEGTNQRADVVVYGRDAKPLLVAECKAPEVDIDAAVFAQVMRYNSILGARYIMVTNGIKHFIHERGGDGRYTPLSALPDFGL